MQWTEELTSYGFTILSQLMDALQCGNTFPSLVPAFIWSCGIVVLAQLLVRHLFQRYIFRRVPWWELTLQEFIFTWMIIYGIQIWILLVKLIHYAWLYSIEGLPRDDHMDWSWKSLVYLISLVPWMCIACIAWNREPTPPGLIWVTRFPWLRREMGPYAYFLRRPIELPRKKAKRPPLRRCFSASDVKKIKTHKPKRMMKAKSA